MDGGRWCGDIMFQWKRSLINTLYNSPTPKSSIGITSKWFAPLLFTTRKGLLEMYTWQKKTKNHMFLLHNSNILIWKFHEILLYLNVSFCSFLRQPAVVILIWSPSLTIWQLNFKNIKQILTWPLYIVYKEQFKDMNNIVSSLLLQMQILHDDILNYKQFLLRWGPPSFDANNNNWLKISFSIFAGGMKVQTLNHYIAIFPSNTGIS